MAEQSNKLQIKEFDPTKICKNAAILMVAKRGSGKSTLCKALISSFRDYPAGVIISYTEALDPFYSNFFPNSFIYDRECKDVFKKVLARQVKIKRKAEEALKRGKFIDARIILLMDDCLSDSKTWGKDQFLREILFNGRHYEITYILTMQSPLEITPNLRDNFDYVCLFSTNIFNDQVKLYKHYAGMFPTFNSFRYVYSLVTASYGVMVLCRRNVGPKLTDQIFHYKAPLTDPPMFGGWHMKKFHEKNYDKNWKDRRDRQLFEPDLGGKKNDVSIPVEKVGTDGKVKFD